MANYTTSADLVEDILFRAGEETDGSSDFNDAALRYLNRAYQALWSGGGEFLPLANEKWWWLRAESEITLLPLHEEGTVQVTDGSTTIQFSDPPSFSLADFWIKITGEPSEVYRIETHTAGAVAATLENEFIGDTSTAADFRAYRTDYDLGVTPLELMSPFYAPRDDEQIHLIATSEFDRKFPLKDIKKGTPKNFTPLSESRVRFNRAGKEEDKLRVRFFYLQEPDDLDNDMEEPLVPRRYRKTLADMALFFLYTDKDDDRAQRLGQIASSGLQSMVTENRRRWATLGQMGQLLARQPQRKTREVLRSESGKILG